MKKAISLLIISMLLSVMILSGCAGSPAGNTEPANQTNAPQAASEPAAEKPAAPAEEPAAPEETPQTLTKVRVSIPPYPMYQIYCVAKEKGIDRKFGIDLELLPFASTAPASQALTRGDLEISANCVAEHLAAIKGSPTLTNFSPLGFFKGFFFVGRKAEMKSWDDLVAELGVAEAKTTRLNEFKGKTFCIIPQRKPLIVDAIAQVGLTENDVKFMNFGDDAKAATAFLSGNGDFYIGSLPQQRSLCQDEKFINVGGSDILGPAGLWYDTMISTDKFMLEDRETALRVLAVMFASTADFYKDKMAYSELAAKSFTEFSGVETPTEEWYTFMTEYDELLTVDAAKDGFFNKDSNLYWKHTVEYNIEALIADGTLDPGVSADAYYGESEKLFFELLQRQDLLDLINQ